MPNFRPTDRLTGFLMPSSVDEWLPEKHLARFVVEGLLYAKVRKTTGSDLRCSSVTTRGPQRALPST
jgi:hypothetical protein